MAETNQTYAAKELDAETNQQEKGPAREFSEKALKGAPEHLQEASLESQTANNGAKFVEKERDNTQQREAVIRPQQAGKIDFKSLQNQSKFTSDRTWPSGKSSPQSPSGKSRNRDKGKKSGKGERGNPQQLYRLSITNPRSNPTIGIAYPQQKVSPPKKLEASRGPVSGSYRFHVPTIPERKAELQQEELNYSRCFQEGSSNLTSPSYTSQSVGSSSGGPNHQHPSSTTSQQQPGPLETGNTQPINQILFPDFQLSGPDMWQSPDRTFSNASFGVASQKPSNPMDSSKPNGFVPLQFQYAYPLMDDTASDSFPCDQNSQSKDFIEASLGSNQVPQNSFSFQSSAEGHEVVQSNTQFSNEPSEDRPQYSVHSKPPHYVQTPHGMPSSVHCTRNGVEDVSNGEISVSGNHQSELNKTALSEKSDTYCPVDTRDTGVTKESKRGNHSKNSNSNQRVVIHGSVHHIRNIAQGQSSQMHFPNKTYSSPPTSSIHMGSAPHDKNANTGHSRVAQQWEGPTKTFSSAMDQNTPYPFQCQPPLEQRQNTGINSRLPWQQIRLTSAMANQNRIELSRQLSNQQLTFMLTPSEWQEDKVQKNNTQKASNSFTSKRTGDAFTTRQSSVKQGCSTISPCPFTNKVDPSQGQTSDAKNKSLYFGVNQTVHGSISRAPSYPPLQVPTMGLMMVSPYDSPSHSPVQNPASTSTCSSLSPESTSPVNSSSDDSQNSKGPPPQFYHQHQGKASSDTLNHNQHHYHSELPRSLHYNQERTKDNIVNFAANNRHPKPNAESGKGCMDSYGMEHHPPPPYSAHQLLASSLATANLDQLDVLLTCKQCDQNFNNLTSFLDHKQYCGQHTFAQNDFKDRKPDDSRKFHSDHTKTFSSGTSFAMSRSSSDIHLSVLGLNKNGEIMPDSEAKVDSKDDPMKLLLPSAPLPDLEMEDAKLDSLITEALNGLGYQSDNAEIDSSFIDAFDDEITTTKCSSNRQTLKAKDSIMFESRSKHEFTSSEKSLAQAKFSFDSKLDCLSSDSKHSDITHKESHRDSELHEESSKEEASLIRRESASDEQTIHTDWVKEPQKSDKTSEEGEHGPRFLLSRKFSERCGLKSLPNSNPLVKSSHPQSPSATRSPTSQKPAVRDGKRKRASGGSWSKELIHKIVQQKNKLHKLHVKGTKNMQFSLVMERVTPTVQNPTFREYDYVSDSDEDCEPVKIASQGRLSQSIRCKYTYTKECKGRIRADKNRESPWKPESTESFEPKKAGGISPSSIKETSTHQRVRRRSSRSSTSSELSTSVSISSESLSSPKSIDHTDSDCERRVDVRKKEQDPFEQEISPQRILKESSTSLALTFTKNTKHYSTDKLLLSEQKDSYTSSKCSNIISTKKETASEHTLTKSTVSLARFKTTRVEVEEKLDHYGCEIDIAASAEEPTTLSIKPGTHLKRPGVPLNAVNANNDKETNNLSKSKRENKSLSKGKLFQKREYEMSHSDSGSPALENFSEEICSNKEIKTDLFSETPSLCSSLMDDVCLSAAKLHDAPSQKDKNCLMPYPLEHDQSLIKSPLSFDTSSMFGDLTVAGFDNNLYPDIQLPKEGFVPIETANEKKDLFESTFSPLLEQRDWGLIDDVTPELPDEIAQYKEDSDISNDKKTSFNHVPFTLPEKIMDYHSNLNSCVSEEELEIKRIVTELESQLQTTKTISSSPLDCEAPKHLTMSKFSPLRLGQDSEGEQNNLAVVCSTENLALSAPTDSHPELFSEPDLPWSSPVQFGLMGGQQCLHTPTHSSVTDALINLGQDNFDEKNNTDLNVLSPAKQTALNAEDKNESVDSLDTATEKSEEMIEHEIYRENLIKSLEVMSDSLSSGLESSQSPQCSAAEENEKQDDEKTQSIENNERTDSQFAVEELTQCSADLDKSFLEPQYASISKDTCEAKVNDMTVTEYITNVAQGTDDFLHHNDTNVNMFQTCESNCESVPSEDCEDPSNQTQLPSDILDHVESEPSVSQVQTNRVIMEEQLVEDLNSKSLLNNPDVPQTLFDEAKEESTVSLNLDSTQAENISSESKIMENDVVMAVSVKHSSQNGENETEIMERAQDTLNSENGQHSTESFHSGDVDSCEILKNDTSKVQICVQSQMEKSQCCEAIMEKSTSFMTSSVARPSLEETVQNEDDESSVQTLVQPMNPSVVPPTGQADKRPLTDCWADIDIINPALTEDKLTLREISEDVGITTPDRCESAAEMKDAFVPHLDLAERTKSKICSSGIILGVDIVPKQVFGETGTKSDRLQIDPNKDTLYDFKLSPLSYSEANFNDCSLSSETINKDMDVQPNIKSSPKDSLDLNACALALDTQLQSNCRLSPIHVQNELELNTHSHLVKLDLPNFITTPDQNDMKYSCISSVHQGESQASAKTGQLSKLQQDSLSTCHVPLETIDYMHLHMNLIKKANAEGVDSQIHPFQLDTMPQRLSVASDQETPNSVEQQSVIPINLTNVPTPIMGKCAKSDVKQSPKKGGSQNAIQGKFQCELCLMFFRTAPGLKRHKAMKHTVKTEAIAIQSPTLRNQGFVNAYQAAPLMDKELKDSIGILDTVSLLQPERDSIPVRQDQLAFSSAFEAIANEPHPSEGIKSNNTEDNTLNSAKTKKNSKIKRSKSMEINKEGLVQELVKPDAFPEELLSILKTDILQAISPDFPALTQECSRSPENQSITVQQNSPNCPVTEEHQGMESTGVEEQEMATAFKYPHLYIQVIEKEDTPTKMQAAMQRLENNGQASDAICKEHTGTIDHHEMKQMGDPCEGAAVAIKCEVNNYPSDENITHSDILEKQASSPSDLGPDLKALFDEESTFSQLFPRNEEMKRKKCARVYGKSNKRQKQMPNIVSDYNDANMFIEKNGEYKDTTDHVFISSQNDHCEYETISLDDAKMLEMCHKSTVRSSAEKSVPKDAVVNHQANYKDTQEDAIGDLLQHTEDTTKALDGSEDTCTERTGSSGAKKDCKTEVPSESCPLQLVCLQDNASRYPSIDIQNLNSTFQLPEIQFFEPGRDISLVEAIASNNVEIKEPEKSPKKPTERKGRKRIETGLKPKDKQYKCKVCFTWFLTLGELDFHKLSHNPSPPPTCYMCVQRKFSSREQLRDHLREKHAKNKAGVWTCGMCLKEISDVWMYNEHLREHATQFARKGQSQSSLLDMPGCLQENAVKNFISSIMQHRSNKSAKDEVSKPSKDERRVSGDVPALEQKSLDVCESAKTKGSAAGGSKHGLLTPLEVLYKAENTPKNVEMHPNCKDPSRDCHHCGKQFPKPFKLQRHLVVHSLQKIFMCHKCPVSYQEAKELKDHLKNEHEEVEELDSRHTTLYTCELCADVMHVIKKSFICSTCNYTFSKKEQFDRHMEKHLAGGNKIFKFRGVVRPCKPYQSKDDQVDAPPNKRRKILSESSQENCVDDGTASTVSEHVLQNIETQGLKSPCCSTDQQSTETSNASVKIEDLAEDLPEISKEHCQSQMCSTECTLPTKTVPKEEDHEDTHAHEVQDGDLRDTREVGTDNMNSLGEICEVKIEDECGAIEAMSPVQVPNGSAVGVNAEEEKMEQEDSDTCTWHISDQAGESVKRQHTENLLSNENNHTEVAKQQSSDETNQLKQDQENEHSSMERSENEQYTSEAEHLSCIADKDKTSFKSGENIPLCPDNSPRTGATDAAGINNILLSSITSDDKDSTKQKKRKEPKMVHSSQRTAYPATRENLGIDIKIKKKFRLNKCDSVAGQRKADVCGDYPVLTSVKDDTASNKIISKHKIGTLGLQAKRNPLDHFPNKKGELVRHLNGDCRGKRGVPGRPIHCPTSKVSLNNSLNKSRPKPGVKSVETHSYRTAESQNNLLSQLFGQRLTGFKIPLRKDTSEPIN